MLPELELEVLGRPSLTADGVPMLARVPVKAVALLAYIAVTGQTHPRAALAALLWGGLGDQRARANLRLTLTRLRQTLGECLATSSAGVGPGGAVRIRTDLERFTGAVAHADAERVRGALALYRGEFLSAFHVPAAPEFDRWVEDQRRQLAAQATDALLRLIEHDAGAGRPEQAIELTARALAIEPWREEIYRWRMTLLAQIGHRSAALAQFRACRSALAEELGVAPEPATIALLEQIESGALAPHAPAQIRAQPPASPALPAGASGANASRTADMPSLPITFFGRDAEIAHAAELLHAHECRVLSVIGPGGIGKTCYAIALARQLRPRFPDGVRFISFAGTDTARRPSARDAVLMHMAEAFDLASADLAAHPQELLRRLARLQALAVLDNFESVLDAAPLLQDLVQAGSELKIVVTSRVRPGVNVEWLLALSGLEVPPPDCAIDPGAFPSIRLLATQARRSAPEFDLRGHEAAAIDIVRGLDGSPLAIALAATWLRILPAEEIARRLRRAEIADLIRIGSDCERQGSLVRVLEQTWDMLAPHDQRILAALSVFRGGFTTRAACAVTQCGADALAVLHDHSLVHRRAAGRLQLHDLQRQFAAAKLAGDPDQAARAHARHARYFLDWSRALCPDRDAGPETIDPHATEADFDNLCHAHAWFVEHGSVEELAQMSECSWLLLRKASQSARAASLFEAALQRADARPALRARWHTRLATINYSRGALQDAYAHIHQATGLVGKPLPGTDGDWFERVIKESVRHLLHRCLPARILRAHDEGADRHHAMSQAISGLGQVAYMQERPLQMLAAGLIEMNCSERTGHPGALAHAYSGAAIMFASIGLHRLARQNARRCEAVLERSVDEENRAYAKEVLGLYHLSMGQWEAAADHLDTAARIFAANGLRHAQLECQQLTAGIAFRRGLYPQSETRWQSLLTSAKTYNIVFCEFWSLVFLAKIHMRCGNDPAIAGLLLEARALAHGELGAQEAIELHGNFAVHFARLGELHRALDHALTGLRCMRSTRLAVAYALDGYANVVRVLLHLCAHERSGTLPWPEDPHRLTASACRALARIARRIPIALPWAYHLHGCVLLTRRRNRAARSRWARGAAAAARMMMPFEENLCRRALAAPANALDASLSEA